MQIFFNFISISFDRFITVFMNFEIQKFSILYTNNSFFYVQFLIFSLSVSIQIFYKFYGFHKILDSSNSEASF